MKRTLSLLLFAVVSASSIGSIYAADSNKNDALAVMTNKISLSQAVTTAEQHVNGKAVRAELEKHNDHRVFDVEVINSKKVMDVTVDPVSGKVLSVTEDKTDHDDDFDKAD
jgi:uncharacterized membrane protein YkoI